MHQGADAGEMENPEAKVQRNSCVKCTGTDNWYYTEVWIDDNWYTLPINSGSVLYTDFYMWYSSDLWHDIGWSDYDEGASMRFQSRFWTELQIGDKFMPIISHLHYPPQPCRECFETGMYKRL